VLYREIPIFVPVTAAKSLCVCCPILSLLGPKTKADALRLAIESMQVPHIGSIASDAVTVSMGAATFPFSKDRNWSADIIIEQADKALYQAKAEGRIRCSYFSVN
jgi:PleD family two-component response regulator